VRGGRTGPRVITEGARMAGSSIRPMLRASATGTGLPVRAHQGRRRPAVQTLPETGKKNSFRTLQSQICPPNPQNSPPAPAPAISRLLPSFHTKPHASPTPPNHVAQKLPQADHRAGRRRPLRRRGLPPVPSPLSRSSPLLCQALS
jgi:hypothetical protein